MIYIFVFISIFILVKKLSTGKEVVASAVTLYRHGYENWDDCPDCCH